MTKEQIEGLARLHVGMMVWGTTDGRSVRWNTTQEDADRLTAALQAIPRLLAERERLLTALKNATLFHSLAQGRAAEEAIAFAEESA